MSRVASINNMNQEQPTYEFNRETLSQIASTIATLFGPHEPFSNREARVLLDALYRLNPSGAVEWLGRVDEFADKLNQASHSFQEPAAEFSLEESVYKEWTRDSTHPLAGKKGFAHGDPAGHMMDLYERYGLEMSHEPRLAPDHLSCLLEFLAILIETRPWHEIKAFCQDHLDWLPAMKEKMEQIQTDEILFHLVQAVGNLIDLCKNSGTLENTGDM